MDNIKKYKNFISESSTGLSYSGGDVTKMPIIGKAITKSIGPFEEGTYDIVEIIEGPDNKPVYVANFWYKSHKRIPQLIHSNLVKSYEDFGTLPE
jgi:hypothetical protein